MVFRTSILVSLKMLIENVSLGGNIREIEIWLFYVKLQP